MGFFSDLKNDLAQAVTEMTDENAKVDLIAEEERLKKELSEMQEEETEDLISILDEVEELEEVEVEENSANYKTEPSLASESFERILNRDSGTSLLDRNLDITGNITGNLTNSGAICFSGEMRGNINATEVMLHNAKVVGDIICGAGVELDAGSVVIGNIIASSALISGALKGNIDVSGLVILESSAIVKGNIKSKSVQMNNGAVIEGMFSQCYAQVNPSTFFEGMGK